MPSPNEIIPKMWEVLNTLSDESCRAALKKCKELEIDPNKGDVPLRESFVNLETAVQLLQDGIEKKKLIQLPLKIQKELLTKSEAISTFLANLNSGSDEVINLISAIDDLNTAVWQYGLHNLSKEVLGYQTKMNQLKNEENQLKAIREEIELAIKQKEQLELLVAAAEKAQIDATAAAEEIVSKEAQATEKLEAIMASGQTASSLAANVTQNESTSNTQAEKTRLTASQVDALKEKIEEFFKEIDEYKEEIDSIAVTAKTSIEGHTKDTSALTKRLSELEDGIKAQIEKATGFSLFHSFQTRQESIAKAKRFWGIALGVVILVSLGITALIAFSYKDFGVGFYLKLSMSIPLIYAISFCTIQYSRERRLEEEYAFKGSISISLDPYQALVSKLINKEHQEERQKFTAFLLDSIQRVFTSPTEKIFDHKETNKVLSDKGLKKLAEIVGNFARAAKP